MTTRPLVLVIHGPSGVGKDTVIAQLRERTGIHRATSTTDRAPREGEQDKVHYHFVTTKEFERRISAGCFAEYARVYDQWKGLEREEIEGPLAAGQDVIIRTDLNGARQWRELLVGAVFVLILATDAEQPADVHREITRSRILRREADISAAELTNRLQEVDAELADAPNNDYVVSNRHNGMDSAVEEILGIIAREQRNSARPLPRIVSQTPAAR